MRLRAWPALAAGALALALGGACAQAPGATSLLDFSAAERAAIARHGPWPPPPVRDPGNVWSDAPAARALGQRLFFDPRLSVDGRVACASCHQPALAFADARAQSPARARPGDPALLDRNAPSLWNAVHERWLGWDGAADSLWSQAIRPLLDEREMATTPARLRATIASDAELACRFRRLTGRALDAPAAGHPPAAPDEAVPHDAAPHDAEPDDAVLVHAAKALGAFMSSLVSARTPFDDFRDALVRGDRAAAAAYPLAAQRGLRLFIGRGRCSVCHVGPLFSNGEFADIGLPFFVRPGVVDPGRSGGISALQASRYHLLTPWADGAGPTDAPAAAHTDVSRKTRHLLPQHRNFGEFKVPGLRNVAHTAPYMHRGQLATLDDVLRHYSTFDPDRLHADGERLLEPLHLSGAETGDLRAFLHTLSDPQALAWAPPELPPCAGP